MKHVLIYTLVALFFCSYIKKENIKLDFEYNYTSVNIDTLSFYNKNIIKRDRFDFLFNYKPKRKKNKDYGTISFYYKRSGIKIITSVSYPDIPTNIEIYFQENGNLDKKITMFKGELVLFGKRITKESTFQELVNDPKLSSMIESTLKGDKLNLEANYFDISTEYGRYFVHFDGMGGNSKVDFITATL